jgi:peptide/nickel transport system ATP-binding protein
MTRRLKHLLEVKNLKCYFKVHEGMVRAVSGVSFHLDRGETIGLVGESGCGKTTTAYAITSLLPRNAIIQGGDIVFKGRSLLYNFKIDKPFNIIDATLTNIKMDKAIDIFDDKIRKIRWREISIIFQGAMDSFNPVYKVGDQMVEAIRVHKKVTHAQAKKRVCQLLTTVGIGHDRFDHYPHEFSGGMKQRAMIAMSLALNPSIVIADEPTTALDVVTQYNILREIKRIQREENVAMIVISHDVTTVAEMSDRMIVMYGGKLMETSPTKDLFENPAHPYTMGLLDSIPSLTGDVKEMAEHLASIPGSPPSLLEPPPGCVFHPRCPYAYEPCDKQIPLDVEVSPGHHAACFLAEDLFHKRREDEWKKLR